MELPFELNVPVKGYQHHAYLLGVLYAVDPQAMIWVHNYFVQLQYNIHNKNCSFNFYKGEVEFPRLYFDSECISKATLLDFHIPITEFIKYKIENGYYVRFDLDGYYLPNQRTYQKEHFWHDILIYGYADGIFQTAGYDAQMRYGAAVISEDVIKAAFYSKLFSERSIPGKNITLFRRGISGRKLEIDTMLIYDQLFDYIYSGNTAERYGFYDPTGGKKIFGLSACEQLKNLLGGYSLDVRPFHILWEHKVCMQARIQFLSDSGLISDKKKEIKLYQKLVHDAFLIRNKVLKVMVKYDVESVEHIQNMLDKLIYEEKCLLVGLLEEMRKADG